MSRDWSFYLEDILESCQKIEIYTAGMSLNHFQKDTRTYDAVLRNLEIIGEASKQIPDTIRMMVPNLTHLTSENSTSSNVSAHRAAKKS